jgi:hypothetical protein
MGDKNFKQVGKLQFSVEVPIDSDLMVAVKLATERRDKGLEEFVDFIKQGATQKDKEKISAGLDEILQINENIKVMEDAAIAVRMYKLDEQKKSETNG